MLIGFTVKNYASFRDEVSFSMLASGIKEHSFTNTIESPYGTMLKSTLIYGANASGKSNLFKAFWFMQKLVTLSAIERKLPAENDCFRFNYENEQKPTFFEVTFMAEGSQYRYGFELLNGKIHGEWLYRKMKRERLMFLRKGPTWETIELKGPMRQAEAIKKHTREDALFITMAAIFNDALATNVVGWFSNIFIVRSDIVPVATINLILGDESQRQAVLKYLQLADTGIEDFSFKLQVSEQGERNKVFSAEDIAIEKVQMIQTLELKSVHSVFNEKFEAIGQIQLPFFEHQSEGTTNLFATLGPLLDALKNGYPIFIDELGARIHPNLTRLLLSLFNSSVHNPHGAQLIGTTHETLLLEENVRKDQVWFIEKDAHGASELYSLHEFSDVRQNEAFARKYLLGVFGAIPKLQENDSNG